MDKTKLRVCFKYLVYVFELYFLYALEGAFSVGFNLKSPGCFAVISAFVSVSLLENEYTAMVFGIFTGFLIDLNFGIPLGVFAIIFCLIGYFTGILSNSFMKANFLTSWFLSTALVSGVISAYFYFEVVMRGFSHSNYDWPEVCVPVIAAAAVVSPFVFLFNRAVLYFSCGEGDAKNKNRT